MTNSRSSEEAYENTPLIPVFEPFAKACIPWGQLAILCYARVSEGWLFFTILPYIAQMVEDGGIEHAKIGFYAESVYSVFELLSMQLIWVKASDRYGRKPVLVVTLFGIAVSAIAFGLSKRVWQMILFRAMCGCFSGSIVTLRCMFSEISTDETRGLVFSYFALTGSLSSLLAPLAGGLLARPAERFGFFNLRLFLSYPYLLPSLVAGLLAVSSACLCAVFLKETLPKPTSPSQEVATVKGLLKAPGLAKVLIIHNSYFFIGFSWMAIAPVFWYTKTALGGLGLTTENIAWLMGITGIFQAVMSACANPVLHRSRGTRGVLWLSDYGFLASFMLQPVLHHVRETSNGVLLVILLAASVVLGWAQSLAFFGLAIAVVEVSPSSQALGSVVSLFLSNAILVRAFSPALATSILAYGIERQIVSGQLVWIVFGTCASILAAYTRTLPDLSELKDERNREILEEGDEAEES